LSFFNGGALITRFRNFWNFRYPGGFLGRPDLLSSGLAFGSGITRLLCRQYIPRQASSGNGFQDHQESLCVRRVPPVVVE